MFEKKECTYCGRKVSKKFRFCPYCGKRLVEKIGIFDYLKRRFKILDRFFEEEFPEFEDWRGGGIFVKIESGFGEKPKIEVKTSGEYKKLEPEIRKKLGLKPRICEVEEVKPKKERKIKEVEEPKTEIKDLGRMKIIKISLPGVKSEDDLEIKRLSQSVEIKGFARDKTYFTLIPIPKNCSISKNFKNGILEIRVEKF